MIGTTGPSYRTKTHISFDIRILNFRKKFCGLVFFVASIIPYYIHILFFKNNFNVIYFNVFFSFQARFTRYVLALYCSLCGVLLPPDSRIGRATQIIIVIVECQHNKRQYQCIGSQATGQGYSHLVQIQDFINSTA